MYVSVIIEAFRVSLTRKERRSAKYTRGKISLTKKITFCKLNRSLHYSFEKKNISIVTSKLRHMIVINSALFYLTLNK